MDLAPLAGQINAISSGTRGRWPQAIKYSTSSGADCTRATDFLYADPCYRVRVLCRLDSLRRCLPINAPHPPSGEQRLHEIKHDGFRIIARKDGKRVKLYSRPGNDLTYRFPLIVEAIAKLRSRSCIIDGEAVACGDDGIASFDRIRYRHNDDGVFLYAFDLIELDGDDLRRHPLIVRKTTLGSLFAREAPGLRLNEHLEADGPDVFHHACMLGLEGIVSKRKDSQYRSGRSPHWLKSKNPNAPAVKREAEEDWGQWPTRRAKPRSS